MTGVVFVDTNVFVYARDSAQAHKQAVAARWLEQLWQEQSGRTSMQVLSELHVTLTRKLKPGMSPEDAWDDVEALLAWDPQPLDRELMLRARRLEARYRLSWWDSLIVAAAQLQDCETLLTEDLQDGMVFEQVTVRSPFRHRAEEARPAYPIESGVARRHRRPGRPKKAGTAGAGRSQ